MPLNTFDIYLLTSEWQDEGDQHKILLYGTSRQLGPVALIFDEVKPVFFIERDEKLPALDFPFERKPVGLVSFTSRPVDALYFRTQRELRLAADRFRHTGVRHFEADVRPADRFLMERFIHGGVRIAGEGEKQGRLTVFHNPKIKAAEVEPEFTVLSIDIETGVSSGQLYSIGVHLTGQREDARVFMLADERRDMPENLQLYPSQKSMLEAFFSWFETADPDLIIGWHVIGFDLMYLERKCREFGLELALSRSDRPVQLIDRPGSGYFATISGRVVIDGPPAMRNNGFSFPNYKLETVAQGVLKTGKLIASDHNKVAEIDRQFREDKPQLARYNLEDCVLVTDIYQKVDLINLVARRAHLSGLMLDQIGIANAALDHYYLPRLHRKGVVAPNPGDGEQSVSLTEIRGLETRPGIYDRVVVLNFGNLLPTLIGIFKIDPLAQARQDVNPVTTPTGARFSGSEHLLPALVTRFQSVQQAARTQGSTTTEKAVELQMNALCHALRTKTCRFFSPPLFEALQETGTWLLEESANFLRTLGHDVIMGDPESIFIRLDPNASDGTDLGEKLNRFWQDRLAEQFGEIHLDIRFECVYTRFILPEGGKPGEPYRYVADKGDGAVVLEGLNTMMTTGLARRFAKALFHCYLGGENVETWLLDQVDRLRSGNYDTQDLVYEKKIKKDVSEYAKNAPPHIKAARMLKNPGRQVRYVWTKRGPVPIDLTPSDIDSDHYIKKQIQPIADLLLTLLDKSFTSVTEPEQMGLF